MNLIEGLRRLYLAFSALVVALFAYVAIADSTPTKQRIYWLTVDKVVALAMQRMEKDEGLPEGVANAYSFKEWAFSGLSDEEIVLKVCGDKLQSPFRDYLAEPCADARSSIDELPLAVAKHLASVVGWSALIGLALLLFGRVLLWIARGFVQKGDGMSKSG
jgi:hypothetical protein